MTDDPVEYLQSLIDDGLKLIGRERGMFLAGRYENLSQVASEKQVLLGKIEDAMRDVTRGDAIRGPVEILIEESRRNERIIAAARQGVISAKRRVAAILAARNGAVAYASDGSSIASRVDAMGKSSRA